MIECSRRDVIVPPAATAVDGAASKITMTPGNPPVAELLIESPESGIVDWVVVFERGRDSF